MAFALIQDRAAGPSVLCLHGDGFSVQSALKMALYYLPDALLIFGERPDRLPFRLNTETVIAWAFVVAIGAAWVVGVSHCIGQISGIVTIWSDSFLEPG